MAGRNEERICPLREKLITMIEWDFETLGGSDLEQRPHRQEFFRDNPRPEAFVRELFQNSLDAKADDSEKVRVRIAFDEVPLNDIEAFFEGLEPHLEAWDVKPNEWKQESNPSIPVLVIEDFGTVGLTGPVTRDPSSTHENDHFLNFWLREGMSGKSGTKGGRWGLGKNTFFMTTKINTFWGLTSRADGQQMLMGKAALKPHTIDNTRYKYYGFFRNNQSSPSPITDKNFLRYFRKSLPIKRKTANGLSLVIPYPVSDINYESVLRSVVMHYFYPILRGSLEVGIYDRPNDTKAHLNRKKITKVATRINWDGTNWEDKDVDELLRFTSKGIEDVEESDIIQLSDEVGEKKEINEDTLGDDLSKIEEQFHDGEVVTVSVPVSIKPKGEDEQWGDFFIFLKEYPPQDMSRSDEYYIRSGIRLPEESKLYDRLGRRPIRGMLVVEHDVVSRFLANAEVPAHTKWNEQTEGFASKYDNGREAIRFIRKSMKHLSTVLLKTEKDRHEGLLQDYFSVVGGESFTPERPQSGGGNRPPSSTGGNTGDDDETEPETGSNPDPGPDDDIPSTGNMFRITRIDGGFKIVYTSDEEHLPVNEELKAAYDVQRGNPFNQYEVFDFDFEELNISGTGFDIEEKDENRLKFLAHSKDFKLEVTGFDESRDLVVRL